MSEKVKPWLDCPRNVAIDIPLSDGTTSLIVGRMINRTRDWITLTDAAMVKDTGRRSEFFAGRYDSNVEIEAYPDNMSIEIDTRGVIIYSWPHELLRTTR